MRIIPVKLKTFDIDCDSVPDYLDCEPFNPYKQDDYYYCDYCKSKYNRFESVRCPTCGKLPDESEPLFVTKYGYDRKKLTEKEKKKLKKKIKKKKSSAYSIPGVDEAEFY